MLARQDIQDPRRPPGVRPVIERQHQSLVRWPAEVLDGVRAVADALALELIGVSAVLPGDRVNQLEPRHRRWRRFPVRPASHRAPIPAIVERDRPRRCARSPVLLDRRHQAGHHPASGVPNGRDPRRVTGGQEAAGEVVVRLIDPGGRERGRREIGRHPDEHAQHHDRADDEVMETLPLWS